ncbi:hypothetical protein U5801_22140 [Lamprobacter modestohalophilus]|uniref:hypothetical protein n=1 Tax=Lamprobacter modestohalophilus TaxID=1064514 RepID=UPI002ADEF19F|nr:hypothetical protein [Lamprobacter modestohalophilus]MEA1052484.1 hypothetical protein [Lamprobacter modestohalophilus]
MSEPTDLRTYLQIADELIARTSKEELADVARLLAINLGYYYERYGEVPQNTLMEMVRAETLSQEQSGVSIAGMKNLIAAVMEVTGLHYSLHDGPAS